MTVTKPQRNRAHVGDKVGAHVGNNVDDNVSANMAFCEEKLFYMLFLKPNTTESLAKAHIGTTSLRFWCFTLLVLEK